MNLKLIIILSVSLLAACSHFEHHHNTSTHADHASHAAQNSEKNELDLSLNGDSKWLMDAHTRSVTAEMANRFSELDLEQQSQEELTQLGMQLNQDLDALIQGCTMEGEAHNALHDFLTSFIPALEELKTTASIDSAKHVEYLLTEYQHFFE
jgi:hypothetical protein